jgi:hypothetical protein
MMALESWIDEIAREELKKLESQHPHRFDYLKTELKLLISEPNLESFFLLPEPISPSFAHCVSTQGVWNLIFKFFIFYFLKMQQSEVTKVTSFSFFFFSPSFSL